MDVSLEDSYDEFPRIEEAFGRALDESLDPRGPDVVYEVAGGLGLPAGALAALGDHPSFDEIGAAVRAADLRVDERIVLASEGGEWGEERHGTAGRRLLHAARLLRDPERYVARFGRTNYEIMLGGCLWHVFRMIGKLAGSVWVLSRPGEGRG